MSDFELPQGGSEFKPKKGAKLPTAQVETPKETDKASSDGSEPKFDQEELMKIFDAIIFEGEYQEMVTIKGKLKVGFRTRSAAEIEDISRIVDGTTANLIATLNEKRSILNLQYALTFYQGKDLRGLKVEEKAAFIKRLPGPVIGSILVALGKFDEKVYEACKEGEENF